MKVPAVDLDLDLDAIRRELEALESTLARTERALVKLDEGSYGVCDTCGEPIAAARLQAMPDSVRCLSCAAAERRRDPPRRR